LETEISVDDIADTTVVGAGHADDISQNDFRQKTTEHTQCKYCQQMNIGLPLPHFESEGLEDGYCQHHEDGADKTCIDGFFVTFVHTSRKSNTILLNHQIIRHFSVISSHIWPRLSQNYAEYPRNLEE
jgi:hypothetical protein